MLCHDTVENVSTGLKTFVNQDTILKEYIPTEETFKTIVVNHFETMDLQRTTKRQKLHCERKKVSREGNQMLRRKVF